MADKGPLPVLAKRRRARSRFGSAAPSVNVYVGNLPTDATEADLRALINGTIEVVSVRVPRSSATDHAVSRGFGFVEFRSAADANAGLTVLAQTTMQGQRLRPRIATNRSSKGVGMHEENTHYEWGGVKASAAETSIPATVNTAPTLETSGALRTAAAKTYSANEGHEGQGPYVEPGDAAMPDATEGWRMFVFKGDDIVENGTKGGAYHLSGSRCFLFGRDRDVVHIPVDNPSCSKLHAVIQFRRFRDRGGNMSTRPYIFDLDSRNGTFLNKERIEGRRFIELRSKDVLQFGVSTRDYVLIAENES